METFSTYNFLFICSVEIILIILFFSGLRRLSQIIGDIEGYLSVNSDWKIWGRIVYLFIIAVFIVGTAWFIVAWLIKHITIS